MKNYDLTFLYGLFGETAAKILLYIHRYGDSYATEIARHFSMHQQTVLYQMDKLERAGILKSRYEGKTRLFRVNPRYVLRMELNSLLEKGMQYIPEELLTELFQARTRPRTRGKVLRRIQRDQE